VHDAIEPVFSAGWPIDGSCCAAVSETSFVLDVNIIGAFVRDAIELVFSPGWPIAGSFSAAVSDASFAHDVDIVGAFVRDAIYGAFSAGWPIDGLFIAAVSEALLGHFELGYIDVFPSSIGYKKQGFTQLQANNPQCVSAYGCKPLQRPPMQLIRLE
jgi:hypothetical protein